MVDFSKLLNRTPEERAHDQERVLEAYLALAKRERDLVTLRSEQIGKLLSPGVSLSQWERQFVESLARRGEDFDLVSQTTGGRLARLSERELHIFEELVADLATQVMTDHREIDPRRNSDRNG